MSPSTTAARAYTCPMHSDVHEAAPGKCPHCGMALLPEGARFGLLRHMLGSPLHVTLMLAVMAALMAAAMMMMR
jgi:heavy metal-binding protein